MGGDQLVEQMRLRTLLKEDEFYRRWFQKVPTITVKHHTPPWRLFIQKEKGGPWMRLDLPEYVKAYAAVRSKLSVYWDMTVHSKPQAFRPPVVKISGKRYYLPMPEGHDWCVYCRRPTVFDYFVYHHTMVACNQNEERCSICGGRKEGMTQYHSPLAWPLIVDQ